MKGICFEEVGRVAVLELPDPVIDSPRDAIVQVRVAGLCGSDLHPFLGRELGLDPGTVMGHEMVGTVVEVGDEAGKHLEIGDSVFVPFSTSCGSCYYCRAGLTSRCETGQLFGWRSHGTGLHGCQSELVRVPLADSSLMKIPDGVTPDAALLLGDNFSTGFYCAEMANLEPGQTCVVIGCGTVGQLCILAARSMGVDNVIAVDLVEQRRRQAQSHGAVALAPDAAASEVFNRTRGRGADAVMELVGLPEAQSLAFQLIRPGGVMSVIGCHCTPSFAFSPVDAYDKNLTYRTGRCPARAYMDRLTSRVASGEFDLGGFVTHRFDVEQAEEAYNVFSNRKDGCIKAVIEF